MKASKERVVHILIKTWYRRTGGSYSSASATLSDGTSFIVGRVLSCSGTQRLWEAVKTLGKEGYFDLPESFNHTIFLQEVAKCGYDCVEVPREKDL